MIKSANIPTFKTEHRAVVESALKKFQRDSDAFFQREYKSDYHGDFKLSYDIGDDKKRGISAVYFDLDEKWGDTNFEAAISCPETEKIAITYEPMVYLFQLRENPICVADDGFWVVDHRSVTVTRHTPGDVIR